MEPSLCVLAMQAKPELPKCADGGTHAQVTFRAAVTCTVFRDLFISVLLLLLQHLPLGKTMGFHMTVSSLYIIDFGYPPHPLVCPPLPHSPVFSLESLFYFHVLFYRHSLNKTPQWLQIPHNAISAHFTCGSSYSTCTPSGLFFVSIWKRKSKKKRMSLVILVRIKFTFLF